jgi:hypothetical protein
MKLILRRAHAVKEKRKDQGIFREPKVENYVEYSLFCTITLSVDEEHALKKYVGDDYAMTYKPGHIREEGGIFGFGTSFVFKSSSEFEYSDHAEAQRAGSGQAGPWLYLSALRKGVTYSEVGGVGLLLHQEEVLQDACRKLANMLSNRMGYNGDQEHEFALG